MARPCFLDFLAYRELGESRGNLHHWTSEEWARWECVVKAEYAPLSSEAAPLIRVNPTLVLFTQGEISSTFGEGSHQGRPIYVVFKFLWAPFCPYTEASVNIVGWCGFADVSENIGIRFHHDDGTLGILAPHRQGLE